MAEGRSGFSHAFTTRGLSLSPRQGRLLSRGCPLPPGEWSSLLAPLGSGHLTPVAAQQVHGNGIRWVSKRHLGAVMPGTDALVSAEPGTLLCVRVADCCPVLVAGPGVAAAIHAGWRGTAAEVVAKTCRDITRRTGLPASALRAAVGPCIGACCYEVSGEVVQALAGGAPAHAFRQSRPGHFTVDLKVANAWQLQEAGVQQVEVLPGCTRCANSPEGGPSFHSHRRDAAAAGRQLALIVPIRKLLPSQERPIPSPGAPGQPLEIALLFRRVARTHPARKRLAPARSALSGWELDSCF